MKLRGRAAFALALLAASACHACPTCKDAFANSPETAGLAKGFYFSILLMLSMIFGLVGFLVYKIVKEARKEPSSNLPA